MVAFNSGYLIYSKIADWMLNRSRKAFMAVIVKEMQDYSDPDAIPKDNRDYFYARLKNTNNLIAFDNAIDLLRGEWLELVDEFLNNNSKMFERLAIYYKRKSDIKRSCFAHMMSKYKLFKNSESDVVPEIMLTFLNSKSVYVRENALKAIYGFGNADNVMRAMRISNLTPSNQNTKLLSDGLLLFEGDHELLIKKLWKEFNTFDVTLQIAIINYMRMQTADYCEQLYELLTQKSIDNEVKIAVLRYFRRYRYEPARDYLIGLLGETVEEMWELSAVAASTLQNYPCSETEEALLNVLGSPNWYIRFNAADSLLYLGVTLDDFMMMSESKDQYAKQMMTYRWQMNKTSQVKSA